MARALELPEPALVHRVGARVAAAADVAHVDDEGDVFAIDALHHEREGLFLALLVGRVADDGEAERLLRLAGLVLRSLQ
jgi:hypothetical protein